MAAQGGGVPADCGLGRSPTPPTSRLCSPRCHAATCEAPTVAADEGQQCSVTDTEHILPVAVPPSLMPVPPVLLQEALSFLTLAELGAVTSVSKLWGRLSEGDCLWCAHFKSRFPNSALPTATVAIEVQAAAAAAAAEGEQIMEPPPTCTSAGTESPAAAAAAAAEGEQSMAMKALFALRLQNPQSGDRVQVAWRGKFRLESLEVFNGLAWWAADVVERSADGSRYRVHYPGWEARWDEWVPRTRLRWGNSARAERLQGLPVSVGDTVEVWCGGVHVPGAWLEGRVRAITGDGRVFFGSDMVTSTAFSMPLARCCLVSKARGRGERAARAAAAGRHAGCCSVM